MVDKSGFPPRKRAGSGLSRLLEKGRQQKQARQGVYRNVLVSELPQLINPRGERQTLLYLGPADDVWRPLILTNATTIIFADTTDNRPGIVKKLNAEAKPGEVKLKTPWLRKAENKWSMLINFRGQERELIYAVGNAKECLPKEAANGYDILLTSASEYVLVDCGKGFRTIVGALRKGGHYLATGDMAESGYGFSRVAMTLERGGSDRLLPFTSAYFLVEKVSNPTAPDHHFIELKINGAMHDAAQSIGGGIRWMNSAIKIRQTGQVTGEKFIQARRNFAAHHGAIMRLMELLRELGELDVAAKAVQKKYASTLLTRKTGQEFARLLASRELPRSLKTAFPEKADQYVENLSAWFAELLQMSK